VISLYERYDITAATFTRWVLGFPCKRIGELSEFSVSFSLVVVCSIHEGGSMSEPTHAANLVSARAYIRLVETLLLAKNVNTLNIGNLFSRDYNGRESNEGDRHGKNLSVRKGRRDDPMGLGRMAGEPPPG